MKELSIEEKAKAYDEAIKRAKTLYDNNQPISGSNVIINNIFPELKESGDERIRKMLIKFFGNGAFYDSYTNGISDRDIVAWLEKQSRNPYTGVSFEYNGNTWGMCARDGGVEILMDGELKAFLSSEKSFIYPILPQLELTPKSALEAIKEEKIDNANKVEPKFKVGDWVVENGVNGNPVQITSFEEDKGVGIKVWFSNGTGTYVDFLKGYHKWTIEDAKDGDVLAFDNDIIVIFKDLNDTHTFHSYCFIQDSVFDTNESSVTALWEAEHFYPATKEQRDTLFAKMKEAGYEWNAEKKELEKIEQESAWSGEHELRIPTPPPFELQRNPFPLFLPSDYFSILRHQPKQEWKPSNEQINTLSKYAEQNNKDGSILTSLYQDLKKLRDE